jgi:hypothetical protein
MTFAYSLTYGNNNREKQIIGNSIMISANTDLTPKWKAGISTGYDFVKGSYSHKFVSNAIYWVGEWISTGHLLEQMRTGDSSSG